MQLITITDYNYLISGEITMHYSAKTKKQMTTMKIKFLTRNQEKIVSDREKDRAAFMQMKIAKGGA